MCQNWQELCSIWSKHNTHSWLTIEFVTWVTWHRWVPLLEHRLITLPEHLHSPRVLSDIRVAQAIVVCVVFCRSLFVLLSFVSFGHCIVCHCIVCHVSIYGFLLPHSYLLTFLIVSLVFVSLRLQVSSKN